MDLVSEDLQGRVQEALVTILQSPCSIAKEGLPALIARVGAGELKGTQLHLRTFIFHALKKVVFIT